MSFIQVSNKTLGNSFAECTGLSLVNNTTLFASIDRFSITGNVDSSYNCNFFIKNNSESEFYYRTLITFDGGYYTGSTTNAVSAASSKRIFTTTFTPNTSTHMIEINVSGQNADDGYIKLTAMVQLTSVGTWNSNICYIAVKNNV